MRGSITLLQYEHGIIRQVTDVLGEMVKKDNLKKYTDQTVKIVDFLDVYVSKYHHKKEERFLFKKVSSLSPEISRGVKDLKADHIQVDEMIDRLRSLTKRKEAYGDGTILFLIKELVEKITVHVRLEEDVFYPMMEEKMPMELDIEILGLYENFSKSKFDSNFIRESEDFAVKVQDEILGPGHYKGIQ